MRKLFCILLVLIGFFSMAGCGMKECKCQAFDKGYHDGVIDPKTDTVYTVFNYTRSDCDQFNEEEMIVIDSITYIHHKVICEEY